MKNRHARSSRDPRRDAVQVQGAGWDGRVAIVGFGLAALVFASMATLNIVPAVFFYTPHPIYENGTEYLFTSGEWRVIQIVLGVIFALLAVVFAIDTRRAVRRWRLR